MANEIKITAQMSCTKGSYELPLTGRAQLNVTQNGVGGGYPGTVSIPTTAGGTNVDLPANMTTPGWLLMRNLDATNYVEFGIANGGTFYPLGRMKAGEPALFRMSPTIVLVMRSNTAACKVSITCIED